MIPEILQDVANRGITRLCHFTQTRNLLHIAKGGLGVLSTAALKKESMAFTPTDTKRYDGLENYISCTIEYPNAWYLDKVRAEDKIFKDWVVLFIRPNYLWQNGTLFCARNAAAGYGTNVKGGHHAFSDLFAETVRGKSIYTRTASRRASCPTDEQAEVLIPDCIQLSDILGVGVRSDVQAKNEKVRLKLAGFEGAFRFFVVPTLFEKNELTKMLKTGDTPKEIEFPRISAQS